MLIPKRVFAVAEGASKENSRYLLAGVKVERHGDDAVAVATNGKCLMMAEWKHDGQFEYPEGAVNPNRADDRFEVVVPIKAWKDLEKQIPKRCLKPILERGVIQELTPEGMPGVLRVGTYQTATNVELGEGRFPKWRDVIPEGYESWPDADFDPEQLGRVLLAMAKGASGEDQRVRIYVDDENRRPAVIVGLDGHDKPNGMKALVMPMGQSHGKKDPQLNSEEAERKLYTAKQEIDALEHQLEVLRSQYKTFEASAGAEILSMEKALHQVQAERDAAVADREMFRQRAEMAVPTDAVELLRQKNLLLESLTEERDQLRRQVEEYEKDFDVDDQSVRLQARIDQLEAELAERDGANDPDRQLAEIQERIRRLQSGE